MTQWLIGITTGILSALLWPSLPALWIGIMLLILSVFLVKQSRLCAGLLLGISLFIISLNQQLADLALLLQANSSIKGTVISLPQQGKFSNRFDLRLTEIKGRPINTKVRAYWPGKVRLQQGDVIMGLIKAKPIHSTLNLGAFNYQKWLLANEFSAIITIKDGEIISQDNSRLTRFKRYFNQQLVNLSQQQYIRALAFGDRSGFTDDHWQTLKASGTGHLFAISGLHLSLVAAFSYGVLHLILGYLFNERLMVWRPYLANVVALSVCFGYATLAGFSLPTLRAFTLICLLFFFYCLKQRIALSQKALLSLAIVFAIAPQAILGAGLWLSFGAIFIIYLTLVVGQRDSDKPQTIKDKILSAIKQLCRLQAYLFIGLLCVNLVMFDGLSLIAPLANLLAVPIVSFIVLPLILAALLLSTYSPLNAASTLLLEMTDSILSLLFLGIESLGSLPFAWLSVSQSHYFWATLLIVLGTLLAWLTCARQWVVVMTITGLLCGLFFYATTRELPRWQIHFVDVGHGNAAIVIKNKRGIIIDTGSNTSFASAATRSVMPLLSRLGIKTIDFILITHDDNDHSGGLATLAKQFPKAKLIANQPSIGDLATLNCRDVSAFDWQNLHVKMTSASEKTMAKENDRSCLYRVNDNKVSALFAGDIERKADSFFVNSLDNTWRSTILQVAHHGSNTSTSAALLKKISPELGIISNARFNQWQLPSPKVLARLQSAGVVSLQTGKQGQISIVINDKGYEVRTYRQYYRPFWYNRDLSFGHYQR